MNLSDSRILSEFQDVNNYCTRELHKHTRKCLSSVVETGQCNAVLRDLSCYSNEKAPDVGIIQREARGEMRQLARQPENRMVPAEEIYERAVENVRQRHETYRGVDVNKIANYMGWME